MVVLLNQLSFFQFVKPSHLFDAALFFSLLALIFLILTFFVLYKKKHTYRTEQFVEKRFELLISKAILNDDDDIEEDNIEELQSLINELPITDLLNMEEYINIDDEILAEEELSLEEIVNMIRGQSEVEEHEEEEEEEEDETITTSDVLNSVEKLIRYVQQNIRLSRAPVGLVFE